MEEVINTYSADQILCAALDVGEHILKNGGEIHRVEDTIERICKSFDVAYCECFTITTLIVASVRLKNGDYSHQIRRIKNTKYDLNALENMNEISRQLCSKELQVEDLRARIEESKKQKVYPFFIKIIGAILAAGGFAIFFGGSLLDGLAAGVIGALVFALDFVMPKFINPLITTLVESIVGGLLSILFVKIGIGSNLDLVIIGTIMLLIPGLAIGNAMRDLFSGDTCSGFIRIVQSILIAVMIAFGYALAISLLGGII